MKLVEFQIKNYRSINDSGCITVGKLTSLVGRNESGKTNLLLALQMLNPAGGIKDLLPIKDFPRHRRLSECTDNTPVVHTTWELEPAEQTELAAMFPRAAGVTRVKIGRNYKATRWIDFVDLMPIEFSAETVGSRVRRIAPVAAAAAEKLEEAAKTALKGAIKNFTEDMSGITAPAEWATKAAPGLASFRQALASAATTLPDRGDGLVGELENLAATITADGPAWQAAQTWAVKRLPVFVYVDEYPELSGHQNIAEYLGRKTANPPLLTEADTNFEKMHLDTFISDPNSVYDVEVNLDERSRGLKWFFSFYITFSADTKGGSADRAILLLDEPGLYLHAMSQGDLLQHLSTDFTNQIIYTTHSPFMVPTGNLDAVRTVNIGQDAGTTVTNSPTGDARTLFPLQAALGFSLSQSLFLSANNLVIEGVTDFWILSCASEYLRGIGKGCLPKKLTLTPAGGAQKIGYMVALLTSERLQVLVLFDEEKQTRETRDDLVKSKLIREGNVVFVSEGFLDASKPSEADTEDLIDASVYETLIRESYKTELRGRKLSANQKIPRSGLCLCFR
jgi:AAA ATPase domain